MPSNKKCECGCGEEIPAFRTDGKPRRFVRGHHRPRLGDTKEIVSEHWARAKARAVKGPGSCELEYIGGCSLKRVEIHHLDGDYNNNLLFNLMRLCSTHHRLVHERVIDLNNPVMPQFFISGGKRRYKHQYPHQPRTGEFGKTPM